MSDPTLLMLFPTTIFAEVLDDHEDYDRTIGENLDPYIFQNRNEVMTGEILGKISMHHDPKLSDFYSTVAVKVRDYLSRMGVRDELFEIYVTKSWLSVIDTDDYHMRPHSHTVSDISFVYYVEVPEDADVISFKHPHEVTDNVFNWYMYSKDDVDKGFLREYTPSNIRSFFIQPKQGLLLLFPGQLPHGTEPNQTASGPIKERRLAVSGDISLHLRGDLLKYETGRIALDHMRKF